MQCQQAIARGILALLPGADETIAHNGFSCDSAAMMARYQIQPQRLFQAPSLWTRMLQWRSDSEKTPGHDCLAVQRTNQLADTA